MVYLPSIGSETSKLKKSIRLIQNWRAGLSTIGVVKELYYEQYYRSDYSPYVERIDTAVQGRTKTNLLFVQESIFSASIKSVWKCDEGKDAFQPLLARGAPVGLYSILDAPRMLWCGSFNISQILFRRVHLLEQLSK